ncbi:MAG: response regulator, partial [Candidatus Latescibacterota bacterium]|nr:response regulator [Candidatus Latescibacterota bacterium]
MSRQRVNILIADDEIFIREGLKEALDHNRYRVEAVSDGQQAHEKLRSGRYHLAILDLRMPGQSGLELLDELRDRET